MSEMNPHYRVGEVVNESVEAHSYNDQVNSPRSSVMRMEINFHRAVLHISRMFPGVPFKASLYACEIIKICCKKYLTSEEVLETKVCGTECLRAGLWGLHRVERCEL